MIKIKCDLPEYLVESNLPSALRVEDDKYVFVHQKKIILSSDESIQIGLNWEYVIYFDDSTLLQLLMVQHTLMKHSIIVTHFDKPMFKCNPYVLRQLGAIGYIKQWVSNHFGSSDIEVDLFSRINTLGDIGPLAFQHELLPIVTCLSERELLRGNPEDQLIKSFEEDCGVSEFIGYGDSAIKIRPLVASGEFKSLIIGQTRKNVVDHAKGCSLALSVARILKLSEYLESWNIDDKRWSQNTDSLILKCLPNLSKDTLILDMTTIDNGPGIISTLGDIWIQKHVMRLTEAYKRVISRGSKDCLKEFQVIEFSLDEEGSSKKYRSSEDPGLNRIRKIVERDKGILEITSGIHRVTHEKMETPNCMKVIRPLNTGTMVRIIVPLLEENAQKDIFKHPKTNYAIRAADRYTLLEEIDSPFNIFPSLHNLWSETYNDKSFHGRELITNQIDKMVSKIFEKIEKKITNDLVIILNWGELPWEDHLASLFLEKLYDNITNRNLTCPPIIHINVPKGLLMNCRNALGKYSSELKLPTLILLEEKNRWCWIGLSVPTRECLIKTKSFQQTTYRITGEHESPDEQYLKYVFDSFLLGKSKEKVPRQGYGFEVWNMACEYLRSSKLFEELTIKSPVNGEETQTGRFKPLFNFEALKSIVAKTFNSKLRGALESDSCKFPIRKNLSKSKKNNMVKLPNGLYVDTYYRCDGLLDYIPEKRTLTNVIEKIDEQNKFKEELTAHLIEIAKEIESMTPGRFDFVVSCTSPTHWFVHQIADGLSDTLHSCGHFVAKRHSSFPHEFKAFRTKENSKALIFTDVISKGYVVRAMVKQLVARKVRIGGVLALLDTTHDDDLENFNEALFQDTMIVALVHKEIKKHLRGDLGWRIDPETLEPVEITKSLGWKESLAGVGALGFSGEEVEKLFLNYGVLRHEHSKHGTHHSMFVCDVKKLFSQPDIRIKLGARLRLYFKRNKIKLIIYPNHSNAYILANMLREICKSDLEFPIIQAALCRYSYNERCYILTPSVHKYTADRIAILDDGFVSGKTMRSLCTAVLNKYPKVKEVHNLAFINEMNPPKTRYWEALAANKPIGTYKLRRNSNSYLFPKLHFSSFISFPHPSYTQENCPWCRKQKDFKTYAKDEERTFLEREFYFTWANEVKLRDVYHDAITNKEGSSLYRNTIQFRTKNKDVIEKYKFEVLLHSEFEINSLINKLMSAPMNTEVMIHSLKALLHIRDTALNKSQKNKVWGKLREILSDPKTKINNRLAVLKAIIWEQVDPPSFTDFRDILRSCINYIEEPLVFGAVLAFSRLARSSPYGKISWEEEKIRDLIVEMKDGTDNKDILKSLEELKFLLLNEPFFGVNSSVLLIKDVLYNRGSHSDTKEDITHFIKLIKSLNKLSNINKKSLNKLSNISMWVIEPFINIEKAARIIQSFSDSYSQKEWALKLDSASEQLDRIRTLFYIDQNTSQEEIKKAISFAFHASQNLKTSWFDNEKGYARELIEPFFNYALETIKMAIENIEKKDDIITDIIEYEYSQFKTQEGQKIQFLCDTKVFYQAVENIILNVRQYSIPWAIKEDKKIKLFFGYRQNKNEKEKNMVTFIASDNGPGVPNEKGLFVGNGKHAEIKPQIEKYQGEYKVFSPTTGGTTVEIKLYSRK